MLFNRAESRSSAQLGIHICPAGACLAYIEQAKADSLPRLVLCEFHPCTTLAEASRHLSELIVTNHLEHAKTVIVLGSEDYDLFLIEAPKASDEERLALVRWSIREYINYPLEEAVVDYIPLPPFETTETENSLMGYAVVVKQELVDQYTLLSKSIGISIRAIDITEAALRNIIQSWSRIDQGILFIQFRQTHADMMILKKGIIYVMRSIVIQDLSSEIAKSIEYTRQNVMSEPIAAIFFAPVIPEDTERIESFMRNIESSMNIPVKRINLSEILSGVNNFSTEIHSRCLLAIGGALRSEQVIS